MYKVKRYLQFFLGVISIVIGIYFMVLQSKIYITTIYSLLNYIFIVLGLFILNDLAKKKFFSKTSFILNKIYGWRNRKYEGALMYLTIIVCMLLFLGLSFLISNII